MAAWMLYAVAVSACLYVAARAAERAMAAWRGHTRWVWVMALLGAVLLPLLPRAERVPPAAATAAAREPRAMELGGAVPVIPSWTVVAPPASAEQWWLGLWALASALVALRYAQASRRVRRVLRAAAPSTVAGEPVLVVPSGAPALVGVLRPRIVVPDWITEFDASLQALVIAHEDEHRRAGDVWMVHALALVLVALPWNLPLWLMARRLRRAIELDCDARVLARYPDVQRYGRVLLAVAQRRGLGAALIAPALAEPVSLTEERIVAFTTNAGLGRAARAALLVVSTVAVGAACTAERPTEGRAEPESSTIPRLTSVWIQAPLAETTFVGLTPEGRSKVMARRAAERETIAARVREQLDSMAAADRVIMQAARERMAARRMSDSTGTVRTEWEVDLPVSALPGSPGPIYPPTAKASGLEGVVLAQFVIRADSTLDPGSVQVIEASDERFADAVRAALPRMRFRAAVVGGRPVPQMVQQHFGFQLSR